MYNLNENISKLQIKQTSSQSTSTGINKTSTSKTEKSSQKERMVYITKTGSKYHRSRMQIFEKKLL